MAPETKAAAVAAYLDANRSLLADKLREHSFFLESTALPSLIETWMDSQIAMLRGTSAHAYQWTSSFVNQVRARGGHVGEIMAILLAIRNMMVEFCSGKIEGVSDSDIFQLTLQIENMYLAHIGDIYGEIERRMASAERRRQKAMADWMIRAYVDLDNQGIIGMVNAAFASMIGFAEDSLLGREFVEICDEETAGEIRRTLRQKRSASRSFDGALIGRRGVALPTRFWVMPMFDEEGLRSGVAVAMLRRTSSSDGQGGALLVDEALQTRTLEDLADSLGIGAYTIDAAFRISSANTLGQSMVAAGAEDTAAYCCRRNLSPEGVCGDCMRRCVFESGQPYRTVTQFRLTNGDTRWVEMTCVPVCNVEGAVTRVTKLVRDITEQRMLEDQFLRQQRTSFVSQLAITVAHQLRNPLGVMIGFAEMLSHGMPADQLPIVIERILRNGIRCKEIVQNLLEFGRGAPGEHVVVSINDLIVDRVRPRYPGSVASRIAWRLDDTQPHVECASEQLVQVFANLIDNALWAARDLVTFETSVRDGSVFVRVSDDGEGVPEVLRDRIFEPFFTTRKEEGGIGLGLSLSRSVIQEHRGALSLDVSVTTGACFQVRLPLAADASSASVELRKPEPAKRVSRRILIVEDETDLAFLLTMALQAEGHEVDSAATGAQAVELIQSETYDAVVIDMLLADELGGNDLYFLLVQTHPVLADRSLFITGDTMKYETRRFLNEVGRPFMEKPFMISDFSAKIAEIMAAPAAERSRS